MRAQRNTAGEEHDGAAQRRDGGCGLLAALCATPPHMWGRHRPDWASSPFALLSFSCPRPRTSRRGSCQYQITRPSRQTSALPSLRKILAASSHGLDAQMNRGEEACPHLPLWPPATFIGVHSHYHADSRAVAIEQHTRRLCFHSRHARLSTRSWSSIIFPRSRFTKH